MHHSYIFFSLIFRNKRLGSEVRPKASVHQPLKNDRTREGQRVSFVGSFGAFLPNLTENRRWVKSSGFVVFWSPFHEVGDYLISLRSAGTWLLKIKTTVDGLVEVGAELRASYGAR